MLQGGLANSSGRTLETTVVATLHSKGFEVVQYREWQLRPDYYGSELLLCNVPYISLYGHAGKTEFLIRSKRYNLEVRIECKWQQSGGSVDEKFPYLYLNAIECMPEPHVILLIDGGGAKLGAVQWLKHVAKEKRYISITNATKTVSVMNLSEFLIWANKTFR